MKRLLIGLVAILSLALVTPDVMAQQRRGNGSAGQGRGSNGVGVQTRAGVQTQAEIGARTGNQGQGQSQRGNQSRQSSGLLTANTGGLDLLRMWEEEKLARDVYTSLGKTSKLAIFPNISRAESQHMQSIERLLRAGGANGNALNNTPGVFVYPEYQHLYASLIATGTRSPLDALMVGAKIEEMDIADLRRVLTQTTDPQVQQVLGHLLQGSQNHLRAFASQIANQGATYNAEFLTQAEFDQIAQSSGQGHGQQSAGRGANNSGQGSQNRGNGQQLGFQGQNSVGQGFGASNMAKVAAGRVAVDREAAGRVADSGRGDRTGQTHTETKDRWTRVSFRPLDHVCRVAADGACSPMRIDTRIALFTGRIFIERRE